MNQDSRQDASADPPGTSGGTVHDADMGMHRILDDYRAAVLARDVEGFMRLYAPEVRVFDAWSHWLHAGADAWRPVVESWFASLESERVRVDFEDVLAVSGTDISSVSAVVTYTALSARGEPLRSMQNRITWVLREVGHVLRIVHEHTSVPIAPESMKPILTRTRAGKS